MDEQHPALRLNSDPTVIAEAIRQALTTVVGLDTVPSAAIGDLGVVPEAPWTALDPESEMVEASQLTTESSG
jgi:hypothetical protein